MIKKTQKIHVDKVREIVAEEIKRLNDENNNHEEIKDIVTSASKLLKAIDAFKSSATEGVMSSCSQKIQALHRTLNDMIVTPGSYVTKVKKVPQRVTLKAVKTIDG